MNLSLKHILLLGAGVLITACNPTDNDMQFSSKGNPVPEFASETAYGYIEDQVAFGPRVPNSEAHINAIQYFREHFRSTAGDHAVFVQEFEQEVYGDTLQLFNLVAAFGLEHSDRIVLAAHWDSRPRAEEDPDNPDEPILGADDGGSGVGVLMELANIFAENELPVGVDIILFDGEDYGEPGDLANYFLGSRYWSQNPPVQGYNPRFGILLDMVGGTGAVFPKEGYSMNFAPDLVNRIWQVAGDMGYESLFIDEQGGAVSDDHVIVERYTGIPMINIIHHRRRAGGGVDFPPYWHTQNDTMEIIDRDVLQAVGDVLLEMIYNRIPR
jgi:glutaminyl-peptide cyclotransferase